MWNVFKKFVEFNVSFVRCEQMTHSKVNNTARCFAGEASLTISSLYSNGKMCFALFIRKSV